MKTKIADLFETYQVLVDNIENSQEIFANSGMKNISRKLYFGFFPLGSGNFTTKSKIAEAEIYENGVMFLGNDFGTISYFNNIKNLSEESNKTVQTLKKLNPELESAFFTNFFLGLRDDISHQGMTNTKKTIKFRPEFEAMCYNFFLVQLEVINPNLVFCLGKEVGKIMSEKSNLFSNFNLENSTFKELFEKDKYLVETDDAVLGKRRFILIPHPSYAHLNWNKKIKEIISKEIKNAYR